MAAVIIIIVVVIIAGLVALYFHLEKKKRERFSAWATQRGWTYNDDRDVNLSHVFSFVDALTPKAGQVGRSSGMFRANGTWVEDQYGVDALAGTYQGRNAIAFTHHYRTVTEGTDDDGNRTTTKDSTWHAIVALQIETSMPELKIGKEHVFNRIASAVTGNDIDFESSEFSRRFQVMSPRRDFAFAFCHPQMIEYLLSQPVESIELQGHWMVIVDGGKLDLDSVEPRLAHLHQMRELMPAELFEGRS